MRLLVIDRDGVINEEAEDFVKTPAEWIPIPGSLEAIARASKAGVRCVVMSNQSGLARGLLNIETLNAIHRKMSNMLWKMGGSVEAVFFCPHGPDEGCACRKPRPGMLEQIQKRTQVPFHAMAVIGDRATDVEAAQTVNAQPVLVKTGHGQATLESDIDLRGTLVYDTLASAVDAIISLHN